MFAGGKFSEDGATSGKISGVDLYYGFWVGLID